MEKFISFLCSSEEVIVNKHKENFPESLIGGLRKKKRKENVNPFYQWSL